MTRQTSQVRVTPVGTPLASNRPVLCDYMNVSTYSMFTNVHAIRETVNTAVLDAERQ